MLKPTKWETRIFFLLLLLFISIIQNDASDTECCWRHHRAVQFLKLTAFSDCIVKKGLFIKHNWPHKVTEWKAPFFLDQTAGGNTMKTARVAARRASVSDFSFWAANNTKTWPHIKTVSSNIPGHSTSPLHSTCATSPRNAFGTGQLPFSNSGTQLRGVRGPEPILRRPFRDGHPILEDTKIEYYGHEPFRAC